VIVWLLDLQLSMQSVPITTDVVSSNLDQSGVSLNIKKDHDIFVCLFDGV
jgi:hypothetical protein